MKSTIFACPENTNFNGIKLLNSNKYLNIQTSDNPYASYSIKLFDNSTTALKLDNVSLSSQTAAMQIVKGNILENSNNNMLLSSRLNNESINNILNKWLE